MKLLKILLSFGLAFSLMACSSKEEENEDVTAESLITYAFQGKDITIWKGDVIYDMVSTYHEGENECDLLMNSAFTFEIGKDSLHIYGPQNIEMFGSKAVIDSNQYGIVKDENYTIYAFNINVNDWITAPGDIRSFQDYQEFNEIVNDLELYSNLSLEVTDDEYIVTGTYYDEVFLTTFIYGFNALTGLNVGMNANDGTCKLVFDKDTKLIQSFMISIDPYETENVNIENISMTINYDRFGDVVVEIPQDIIDHAIDVSAY